MLKILSLDRFDLLEEAVNFLKHFMYNLYPSMECSAENCWEFICGRNALLVHCIVFHIIITLGLHLLYIIQLSCVLRMHFVLQRIVFFHASADSSASERHLPIMCADLSPSCGQTWN